MFSQLILLRIGVWGSTPFVRIRVPPSTVIDDSFAISGLAIARVNGVYGQNVTGINTLIRGLSLGTRTARCAPVQARIAGHDRLDESTPRRL